MPQLFRPPRPFPAPLEPSPPFNPASMPSPPPPAPPAAADQKRPSALMKKMKLLVPYALSRSFGGCINRPRGMAVIGVHIVLCILYLSQWCQVICFDMPDPEVTRLWQSFFRVLVYLLSAVSVLQWSHWICYKLYVLYAVRDDPPRQNSAAAEVILLPPPPPEMDMC